MKTVRNILFVVMVMLVFGGSVFGADVIDDPIQLIGTGTGQDIMMTQDPVSYLMERTGGGDVNIEKGGGQYHIFFCEFVDGDPNLGIDFGAYLSTDNYYSNEYIEYQAWCQGKINRVKFQEDEGPDYILAIYDDDGGQFALRYPGGVLVLQREISSRN